MNQPAKRPLSPHLQVFGWHILMFMSIVHRISGWGLIMALPVLTWWLASVAAGPAYYNSFMNLAGSPFGLVCLAGWSWALFYHMMNGIRHMVWDTGRGFALKTAKRSGWFVLISSALITLALWACLITKMNMGG